MYMYTYMFVDIILSSEIFAILYVALKIIDKLLLQKSQIS